MKSIIKWSVLILAMIVIGRSTTPSRYVPISPNARGTLAATAKMPTESFFPGGVNNGGGSGDSFGLANRWVNVKDYGAAADTQLYNDGSMGATGAAFTGGSFNTTVILDYRGVNPTAAVDVFGHANGSSTSAQAPSVTTTVANDWLLSVIMPYTNTTWTAPSDETQRVSQGYVSGGSGGLALWAGDKAIPTPGATSTETMTITSSSWVALSIALEPASGQTISFVNYSLVQSSGTMTDPTGVQVGDVEVACSSNYQAYQALSGWNAITNDTNGNEFGKCWWREYVGGNVLTAQLTSTDISVANASGGNTVYTTAGAVQFAGNYIVGNTVTISGNATSANNGTFTVEALTDTTLTVNNASGVSESSGSSVTVWTPRFTSADVGKQVCVQKTASNTTGQTCGTVSVFDDTHDLTLSFSNASGSALNNLTYAYGTLDQAAVVNALTALSHLSPPGGTLYFPGVSFMNAELDIPAPPGNYVLLGSAFGAPTQNYQGSTYLGQPTSGMIFTKTATVTNASIYINQLANPYQGSVKIENMAIMGGVGFADDGPAGSVGGIYGHYVNQFQMQDVTVANFAQSCIYLDGNWQAAGLDHVNVTNCGTYDAELFVQGSNVTNSTFQNAGTADLVLGAKGLNIFGNTIQSSPVAVVFNGGSGHVDSNYLEHISSANFALSAAATGWTFNNNTISTADSAPYSIVFSAATTAIGAAASYPGFKACVSDATTCVNGTPYASGGSTACLEYSNGTNWIDSGAGCQ